MQVSVLTLSLLLSNVAGFVTNKSPYRLQPVHENFFLDIAEDPAINTPRQIFGEVAYKNFVKESNPNGLLARQYNIVERVRELKLLKLTAESGLLEELESKGLSLSKLEKLLPLADDLGVLPLVAKNKELLLSIAPLIIEPAPALIPIIVSLLKTGPGLFLSSGFALSALGAYELSDPLLGVPLLLTGFPLAVVGLVLNAVTGLLAGDVPTVKASVATSSPAAAKSSPTQTKTVSFTRPVAKKRAVVAAKPVAAASKPVIAKKAAVTKVVPKTAAPIAKKAAVVVAKAAPVASKSAPVAAKAAPKAAAPAPKAAPKPAPKSAPKLATKTTSANQNGKRKTVKINR